MHIDVSKVPIPPMMNSRPRDRRGLPIPYFQYIPPNFENDRVVDFRVTDPERRIECLTKKLCGLCGEPLLRTFAFIGGPLSRESRVFSDPPSHENCAKYAMKVCPFLAIPSYKVGETIKATRDGYEVITDAMGVAERPPQMFLYITDGFEMVRVRDGNTGEIHPMIYALANDHKRVEEF